MNDSVSETDIVIAGGGPVGLYLAGLIGTMGFSVVVLEKKKKIDLHSKSLGIHPVSMELFKELEIADQFLEDGIPIRKGIAFIDRKKIGEVDFSTCPDPFNFILALPQNRTEQILQNWIQEIDSVKLIRGAELTGINQSKKDVSIRYLYQHENHEIRCDYAAGCDGKNSFVRQQSGIQFDGKKYHDTYIMGDFSDNTKIGTKAAVYLHRDGLIETFPLPGRRRRWVVKTDEYMDSPTRHIIEAMVLKRLDHTLLRQKNTMISSFGVEHFLANTFHSGRVALAGDSAHVVSPIGGQGMNLGWLTARRLADTLKTCMDEPDRAESALQTYTEKSRSIAKKVARRAELNMWLGRKSRFPLIRNLIAQVIVSTPLQRKMARIFTMRDL